MFEESVLTNTNNMLKELFMLLYIINDNINTQLDILCNNYMKILLIILKNNGFIFLLTFF